jgi:hypothetical protein
MQSDGCRWIAPANWVYPSLLTKKIASDISKVELITKS